MTTDLARSGAPDPSTSPGYVLDQPGGNLALDLFVLDQHLGTMLEVALAGTGVTPAQYAVYAQLSRGSRTPGQLGKVLGLRPTTLSGYLSAMQARGDVARTRNDADRRSALLTLTAEGRAQRNTCRLRIRRAVAALNAELGSAENVTAVRLVLGQLDDAVRSATTTLERATG